VELAVPGGCFWKSAVPGVTCSRNQLFLESAVPGMCSWSLWFLESHFPEVTYSWNSQRFLEAVPGFNSSWSQLFRELPVPEVVTGVVRCSWRLFLESSVPVGCSRSQLFLELTVSEVVSCSWGLFLESGVPAH